MPMAAAIMSVTGLLGSPPVTTGADGAFVFATVPPRSFRVTLAFAAEGRVATSASWHPTLKAIPGGWARGG